MAQGQICAPHCILGKFTQPCREGQDVPFLSLSGAFYFALIFSV